MNYETKQKILDEIEKKVPVFKKVSSNQYRIRCPICGDSQKDPRDSHCYIKCSYDANEPLLYICFKCNSRGMVGKRFLERLNLDQNVINQVSTKRYNRISSFKKTDVNIITGTPMLGSKQAAYVETRLGDTFSLDDLDRFKIVWDMRNIFPYIYDQRVKNSMPNNNESISFISHDKSMLLTRFFDDEKGRWRKIKLFPSDGKSLYTIKSQFNLFDVGNTCVYIAEGIMDILSVYRMTERGAGNKAYIATLGSDYLTGVEYAISKGMIGDDMEIYIDSDVDEKALIMSLKKYKWLYRSIRVFRNTRSKDVGVPIKDINLMSRRV